MSELNQNQKGVVAFALLGATVVAAASEGSKDQFLLGLCLGMSTATADPEVADIIAGELVPLFDGNPMATGGADFAEAIKNDLATNA